MGAATVGAIGPQPLMPWTLGDRSGRVDVVEDDDSSAVAGHGACSSNPLRCRGRDRNSSAFDVERRRVEARYEDFGEAAGVVDAHPNLEPAVVIAVDDVDGEVV